MVKLHKALSYVRQQTLDSGLAYVRRRTIASFSVGIVLLLAGCAPSVASRKVSQGLVSIQSAVTCPAPPAHTATVDPPRHIAAPTNLTASRDIGYCAYIDTSRGIISVRLRPEYAPHAVADFVYLAQHGFYDGLSVYQTCPATTGPACPAAATVALAGDPSDTGSGGPGYAVAADPVVGSYLFGAVAMYGDNPSRIGSDFFISTGDSHTLARKYDIFGQVTNGIPALATLQKGDTIVWIAIVVTAPEP
jgi:cyclophilin family peptidyl-prolyl cis-trans isomerase